MERTYRKPAVISSVAASEDDRNMHFGFDRWPRSFTPRYCAKRSTLPRFHVV
jgi:hypothetical protein